MAQYFLLLFLPPHFVFNLYMAGLVGMLLTIALTGMIADLALFSSTLVYLINSSFDGNKLSLISKYG